MRRAFTLLEMVVALGLSLMVLLVATKALGMVAQALSRTTALATENELLRTGLVLVLDDLDYWQSHANPGWPYLRGYNSLQTVDGTYDGVGYDGQERTPGGWTANPDPDQVAWNKRPFRRVSFERDDPGRNATWLAPHQPEAWIRTHLLSGARPIGHPQTDGANTSNPAWGIRGDEYFNMPPSVNTVTESAAPSTYTYPLPGGNSATIDLSTIPWVRNNGEGGNGIRGALFAFKGSQRFAVPYGWTGRHIFGDFSLLSNVAMGADPLASALDRVTGARQRASMAVFEGLGLYAAAEYLPPGTQSLLLRPNDNLVLGTFPRTWEQMQDVGEMPYENALWAGDPISRGGGSTTFRKWLVVPSAPEAERQRWFEALWLKKRDSNRTWFRHTSQELSSLGTDWMYVGLRLEWLGGSDFSPWEFLDQFSVHPYGPYYRKMHGTEEHADNIFRNYLSSTTRHLPRAYSDQPLSAGRDSQGDGRSLQTNIFRFRKGGHENAYLKVEVGDPQRGRFVRMAFSAPHSTSYRGARQHWALATAGLDGGLPAMGDHYAP